MKKVLSVALALVMLFSCFSLMSFAIAPNTAVEVTVAPKEATYKKGDIVTFEVFYETSSEVEGGLGAPIFISFAYDSTVFEPADSRLVAGEHVRLSENPIAYVEKGYPVEGTTVAAASTVWTEDTTAEDRAIDSKRDKCLKFSIGVDPAIDVETLTVFSTKKAAFAFQLKLKEDANPAGSYSVGVTRECINPATDSSFQLSLYDMYGGLCVDEDPKGTYGYTTDILFGLVDATVNVGAPAPAGPAVTKAKSQVKMTATSTTTVADEFSFRVISKISDSDWDTYFKNTGVADAKTDYITAVGMVAYKGAAAFDAETAKSVVAGALVADYAAAKTDYISKVSDTADAEFGAIIKANHSKLGNDVTYMGFVQYVDASGHAQTIFYETAETAALSTNYNNIVNAYLAANPFKA